MSEPIVSTGDGGTMKQVDDNNIELTMFEGKTITDEELRQTWPDFEIVERDGQNIKLQRIQR